MDDAEVALLVLGVAVVAFAAGLLVGYATRAAISHQRYARGQLRRIDSWQKSGSAELKEVA
jgi:hypothetical protein